jgi:hypothetical protein
MSTRSATSITHRREPLAALCFVLVALVAGTALPAPAAAYGGDGLRAAANGYRATESLAPLPGTALLDEIATARAADMAAKEAMEHDMAYLQARLDAAGACWTGYGEIIARSSGAYSYDHTMLQWWNSAPHHAIVMNTSYNAAGGAWQQSAQGTNYSVMVFATLCGSAMPSQGYADTPFTDIGASSFRNDIAWLFDAGITGGCSADSFCPSAAVTRAQMASFLARALSLPPASRDYFSDDNGTSHEGSINRLAEAGIATGCGTGRYCPSTLMTRDQMASFLVRARGLSAGASLDLFDDDDSSQHEANINRLAYSGVTAGCADRRYCPTSSVSRGQMAAFLHRAFGS